MKKGGRGEVEKGGETVKRVRRNGKEMKGWEGVEKKGKTKTEYCRAQD